MTHEATKTSTRRVRFADSVGRELVTIFLVDLISNFYSCSLQSSKNPFHHRAIEAAKKSLSLPTPPSNISNNSHSSSAQLKQEQQQQHHQLHTTIAQNHSFLFRYSPIKSASHHHLSSRSAEHYSQDQQQQQRLYNDFKHPYHLQNNEQNSLLAGRASFVCDFTQPIQLISFKERVRLNKVHLETCHVSDTLAARLDMSAGDHQSTATYTTTTTTPTATPSSLHQNINNHHHQPIISISCTIRVLNLSYEKSVTLRYTTDDWHTFTDCSATYRPGSCDGWSDKFVATFTVHAPGQQPAEHIQRVKFAVKFVSQQEVFWDNNGGLNYLVKRANQ